MGTSTEHVMTIANSIIGVSVLAMPFCFKQCGIVLSILLLLLSGIMTRLACHYLLKSAITTRRRNFEFLAFHAFGPSGKLFVELGIIGFMLGTCIAFFVVMGDLGPAIIGPTLNIDSFSTLRPSVLMGLGLLVVLPLGLLKNVDSLSAVCAASIAFYLCLVLKVMAEATTHLISWDWVEKVNLWRPAGIPQCIPIFSMALSCQTQLFEIFDSVPNTSLEKMNAVIKSAINMCTAVYISVGFFGYIAFCTQNFSGNLLMSFSPTVASEIIKLGFVLSVAVSFPLVIFPCRASLHSLLFRRGHTPHHEFLSGGGDYIPEPRFKCLTIFIVMFSLGTGLLIPNIEVVLGLVGSTIGIMICIMFPALIFVCISNKHNNERLVAKILFAIGLIIMILGTYTNLYATEEALSKPSVETQKVIPPANVGDLLPPQVPNVVKEKKDVLNEKLVEVPPDLVKEIKTPLPVEIKKDVPIPEVIPDEVNSNKRKEPPIPVEPRDSAVVKDVKEINIPSVPSILTEIKDKMIDQQEDKVIKKSVDPQLNNDIKKDETISNDAIKREEDEMKESKANANVDVQKKNEELLDKLTKNEEKQKKIIQEQKAILEELKKQNLQQQLQNNINSNQDKFINDPALDKLQKNVIDENLINKKETEVKMEKELPVKKQEEMLQDHKIDKVLDLNLSKHLSIDNIIQVEKAKDNVVSSKDNNLPSIMTNEMVKGVPLPLAVKDSAVLKKSMLEEKYINESKKVDNMLNNKPQVRDILGENKKFAKEEREKRDLDIVVKMDERVKEMEKPDVVPEGKNDKKEYISEKITHHTDESLGNIKEGDNGKGISLVKILDEGKLDTGENCPKPEKGKIVDNLVVNEGMEVKSVVPVKDTVNNIVTENKEDNHLGRGNINQNNKEDNQEPVTEHELIKTPSILSNPEVPEIDTANMKNGNPVRNSLQEMKPMSRDLKSVQNSEDTRAQERAAEVT